MAKVNGTTLGLWVKRTGDPNYTFVGIATSDSLDISVSLEDATTKASEGWAENINGLRSASGSVTGLHDPEETFTKDEVFEIIDNRESIAIQYGDLNTVGATYYEFSANIDNFTLNSDMESPVGFDFSFQATGKVQSKTVSS